MADPNSYLIGIGGLQGLLILAFGIIYRGQNQKIDKKQDSKSCGLIEKNVVLQFKNLGGKIENLEMAVKDLTKTNVEIEKHLAQMNGK